MPPPGGPSVPDAGAARMHAGCRHPTNVPPFAQRDTWRVVSFQRHCSRAPWHLHTAALPPLTWQEHHAVFLHAPTWQFCPCPDLTTPSLIPNAGHGAALLSPEPNTDSACKCMYTATRVLRRPVSQIRCPPGPPAFMSALRHFTRLFKYSSNHCLFLLLQLHPLPLTVGPCHNSSTAHGPPLAS